MTEFDKNTPKPQQIYGGWSYPRAEFDKLSLPPLRPFAGRVDPQPYHFTESTLFVTEEQGKQRYVHDWGATTVNVFDREPRFAQSTAMLNAILDTALSGGVDPALLRKHHDTLMNESAITDYWAKEARKFSLETSAVKAAVVELSQEMVRPLYEMFSVRKSANDASSRSLGPSADRYCSEAFKLDLIVASLKERLPPAPS
jgi:hypothetical protein